MELIITIKDDGKSCETKIETKDISNLEVIGLLTITLNDFLVKHRKDCKTKIINKP